MKYLHGFWVLFLSYLLCVASAYAKPPIWGFYAHQKINRLAVYSLPPELFGFYKANLEYITENAINPDQRRYVVQNEASQHYIDLDVYPDSVQKRLPNLSWKQAVERFSEDSLRKHGIVPWHIVTMKYRLETAFREKNLREILRLSADMGHYIADAHVPLHTTRNYNGQLTNQIGIHAFWESRLPELFSDDYDLLIGQATYIERPREAAWRAVLSAHTGLDSVLTFERNLTVQTPEDKKFTIDQRNNVTQRMYSREFSERYHQLLARQVERQMRASVKMIADMWLTAWIDAGQPDLSPLGKYTPTDADKQADVEEKRSWLKRILSAREEQ